MAYDVAEDDVPKLSSAQKALLTTWLIAQRNQGNHEPRITKEVIEHIKTKRPLPVYERATRLLRFIANDVGTVGNRTSVHHDSFGAYAWSESTNWDEVDFLIDYLQQMGWVQGERILAGDLFGTVTVAGYSLISNQDTNVSSSQAFIAMWFHESMTEAFEKGVRPAIEEAGYEPLRIDQKEHINKIDDEIIAEIRRSTFLVADFTHGDDGARGGVYYEAGFAQGFGLPVIFMCREDSVGKLHFDTNHYNHIVWSTPDELREKLKNRILAVIGEGPEA